MNIRYEDAAKLVRRAPLPCRPSVAAVSAIIVGLLFGFEHYAALPDNAQEQVDRYYKVSGPACNWLEPNL